MYISDMTARCQRSDFCIRSFEQADKRANWLSGKLMDVMAGVHGSSVDSAPTNSHIHRSECEVVVSSRNTPGILGRISHLCVTGHRFLVCEFRVSCERPKRARRAASPFQHHLAISGCNTRSLIEQIKLVPRS
jgi:hypothetical protein